MKTKTIEVCDAILIDIACIENDSTDIRCGGPATLGYEFYISPNENVDEIKTFLRDCIKKYNRPFRGLTTSVRKDFPVKYLWTKEKMEECIKENEVV